MRDRGAWTKTATTWLSKSVARIVWEAQEAPKKRHRFAILGWDERWLIGYEAMGMIRYVLDEMEFLAPVLNPEDIDEARGLVRDLEKVLRDRALADKLENVEGRTPEEAALFRAKAEQLRGTL